MTPMQLERKGRLVWLDAVKGILILFIMISHSCGFPLGCRFFVGGFVFAFFVLSGFTFHIQPINKGVLKKTKTLLIPYFFYGILSVFVLFLRDILLNGFNISFLFDKVGVLLYSRYCLYSPYNCEESGNVFFLRMGLEPIWFLTCLFMSFVWTYIYFNSIIIIRKFLLLLFFAIPFFCTYMPILLPWSLDTSFVGALLIIIGYYLREPFMTGKVCRSGMYFFPPFLFIVTNIFLFIIPTLITGTGNVSVGYYENSFEGYLSIIIQGITKAFIFSFIFIIYERTQIVKAFAFLGRQSLRLMCLHLAVFVITGITEISSDTSQLYVFGLTFISIVICVLLSLFFDMVRKKYNMYFLKYV